MYLELHKWEDAIFVAELTVSNLLWVWYVGVVNRCFIGQTKRTILTNKLHPCVLSCILVLRSVFLT